MWTNHSFYKYHWCHVIDTVIQLYATVGLGIRLKSMSVRSWRWASLRLPRNPRVAARVLLERANLSFVLMYVMTDAYGSLGFSAIFSASLLFTLLHWWNGYYPLIQYTPKQIISTVNTPLWFSKDPLTATAICKLSAFKEAPSSNGNVTVHVLCFWRGQQHPL